MARTLRSSAFAFILPAALWIAGAAAFGKPPLSAAPAPSTGPFPVAGTLGGVALKQVASGLGTVTGITHAGDARLFLTARDGRILIRAGGGNVLPQPFLDIHDQTTTDGERGLLSTAFHPHYAETGFFFVNYTNLQGNTVIARYHVAAGDPNLADPASAKILLTIAQPFSNHNGGQLQFGPDGYLYIGMGDGGDANDPACRAQKTDGLLGKMLRIDVDQNVATPPYYGIPPSNPFRGAGNPLDEIWASGVRNPWRFSFDRQTGDLWIADVGQGRREEIDFQPAGDHGGENYGWKIMEGTLCNLSEACPASVPACDSAAFTPPVLEYDHGSGCAVTGGYVYRGSAVTALRGSYVFGDLCSGTIWVAARQGSGFTVRTVSGTIPQLISFGEDSSGELYASNVGGQLFRFDPTPQVLPGATVGLYDPPDSLFDLKSANSAGAAVRAVRFGPRGNAWVPLAGDWDGDGKTTIGFYDPANSLFRLKNSASGGAADILLKVNAPSRHALPVVGDWDGDGKDTVGLYEPSTRTFYLKNTLTGPDFDVTFAFGPSLAGLLPVAGDWNGDGRDSVGVFDPVHSVFYLTNGTANTAPDLQVQFGPAGRGSLPVIGAWTGGAQSGIGVYDPASAVFRLRNTPAPGAPDAQFAFGPRRKGWKPLAGRW
jgi:glucose/arabinose dehydrogenase